MATQQMTQQQLAQELQRLCASKESGSLIANAAGSALATITIQDGKVIALGFRIKKGADALAEFRKIGDSKVSFRPGMLRDPQPDLPDTDEIILSLGGNPTAPVSVVAESGQAFGQQALQTLIEQEVATMLGPSAKLLCAEYFDQQHTLTNANSIRQAVVQIAGSVVGNGAAENMAATVIKKIGL